MKLPSIKKILREDVKDAPPWINSIINPVNSFMESVYQTLNANISFNDNIASFIKEISYKTDSLYPVAADISFASNLKTKATGVLVMQAVDADYIPAPGPVYAPWVENNGVIIIKAITGLAPSKSYTIRLLVT